MYFLLSLYHLLLQLRNAEQQLEWVRSERDEERAKAAKEARETTSRLSEADVQLRRLKEQRREEQKKAQRERTQLADRARELEEEVSRAQADAARAGVDASAAVSRADKALAEALSRIDLVERALSERDREISAARGAAAELEAKVRSAADALRHMGQRLAQEEARSAALVHGTGVDALPPSELETLARVHDQGLRRTNAALAKLGRPPVGGGAPGGGGFAGAGLQPLDAGGFRSAQAAGQQVQQTQQAQQRPGSSLSGGLQPALSLGMVSDSDCSFLTRLLSKTSCRSFLDFSPLCSVLTRVFFPCFPPPAAAVDEAVFAFTLAEPVWQWKLGDAWAWHATATATSRRSIHGRTSHGAAAQRPAAFVGEGGGGIWIWSQSSPAP
jgi:hypothetical protein